MNELGTGESSTVRFWFHHGQPPLAGSSVVPKPFEAFDHDSSVGPILVLNLERQVERWKLFQSEARRHQLRNGGSLLDRCERVTAVDGLTAPSVPSFRARSTPSTLWRISTLSTPSRCSHNSGPEPDLPSLNLPRRWPSPSRTSMPGSGWRTTE